MNTNGGDGTGTDGSDVILGTSGRDVIRGNGGDDTICGSGSGDWIDGGPGDDLIFGGGGNDQLNGRAGDDEIFGQFGADRISGGDGHDRLLGGVGFDRLDGGPGDDFMQGSGGDDTLHGNGGNDSMYGKTGDDTLHGGDGHDELYGASGDDGLFGGEGSDVLHGASGNDDLYGGSGADKLYGKAGNDWLWGDDGDDELYAAGGNDMLFGGPGNDELQGGDGDDLLRGDDGNDVLYGQAGSDSLFGGILETDIDELIDEEILITPIGLPGTGTQLRLARANWSSGYVHAQILHDVLEELGYDVTSPDTLELAPSAAYAALATNEIDIYPNSWYPGHLSFWDELLPNGERVGANLTRLKEPIVVGGGRQGMVVTKAWADREGFTTLDQINADSALWSQLDSDGNGRGEIYGCPGDWTCDDVIESQIAFAGWNNLEQTTASYGVMFDEFMAKARRGEPAIIYVWAPTVFHADALPGETTMWLSVNNSSVLDESNPLGIDGGEDFCQRCDKSLGFQRLGSDVCLIGPDGCQLGWSGMDIEITVTDGFHFEDGRQAAHVILNNFSLPAIDLSIAARELQASTTQADVERIAAQWIADNRALVDGWLAAARSQ